ncbi:hypothetical protein [Spiroplasma tabanidicola]|uniref:CvpA family protein n=1 Tax=Spiroplasma tabanidicola TaxID=324079 RepID=A0A6I6C9J6_9MOLU|nr:hypothetical protein [Spiroplasma tabanidicola]QGS52129.1 CvpA family protein [Spiroplasma tabanidicola]
MVVNIGPWWLYDFFTISILIGAFIFGLKRGFLITFYILFLELIVVIIITFIPPLLVNATMDPIMKLWSKLGLEDIFDQVGSKVGDVFFDLLKYIVEGAMVDGKPVQLPSLSWDGMGTLILKIITGLGLYVIYCVLFIFIINLIGFAFYFSVKSKIRKIKILGAADMLLGGFNGLAFGMIFVVWINWILSLSFFATETQKFGMLDYNSLTDEQKVNWAKNGNSYSRYSLSNKLSVKIPQIKAFSYIFTNACIRKYILNPASTIVSQLTSKGMSVDNLANLPPEVLETYSILALKGYVETNPTKIPISVCVELLPDDSRILLRLVSELALVSTKLASAYLSGQDTEKGNSSGNENGENGTDENNTPSDQSSIKTYKTIKVGSVTNKAFAEDPNYSNRPSSIEIMNALEQYKAEKAIEDNEDGSGFMNLERFKDFYAWAGEDITKNPFLKNNSVLLNDNASDSDKLLGTILKNPTSTYNLLRNITYVNRLTQYPNVPGFIPSIWSNLYFTKSLELSYTSALYKYFTTDIKKNWDNLNDTSKTRITRDGESGYNEFYGFWIQYYFDFAKLGG